MDPNERLMTTPMTRRRFMALTGAAAAGAAIASTAGRGVRAQSVELPVRRCPWSRSSPTWHPSSLQP